MRKVAIPVAILALIGLDQWVKHWVVANISLNQVIKAIPGVFSLTYLQNRGAAFSILQNQKYFFVFVALIFIGVIVFVLIKVPTQKKYYSLNILLVMIAAGAVGNMIDRVRYLGSSYIHDGGIALEDKENLSEMYQAYKALGGNGHLSTVMAEVERLPVAEKR